MGALRATAFLGRRCHGCGVGHNVIKNLKGTEHPWMGTYVTYDFDYEVVGCDSCTDYIGNRTTAKDIDQAITAQLGPKAVAKLKSDRDILVAAGKLPALTNQRS